MKGVAEHRFPAALALLLLTAAAGAAHIGYLYPAGGRAGDTVEVLAGGSSLWGVTSARVSGGGVEVLNARPASGIPTVGSSQKKYLRQWIERIERGDKTAPEPPPEEVTRTWHKCRYWEDLAAITPLERELVSRKVFLPHDPLQSSPSISGLAIVRLRIAPDAAPGRRELRLVGRDRISDPLPFYIDTVPEYREPRFILPERPRPPVGFTVPAVLNGQILPGETDVFSFTAKMGEVLTFDVKARELVPFLGDGVPGHFQAVLEIFDSADRRVAAADDHHFDPDPVLVFRAPRSGNYTLRIRDALYRGREDFVYRVRVVRGAPARRIPAPPPEYGGPWRAEPSGGEVTLPAFIGFTISRPGGGKFWRFRARSGETLEAEVLARRLRSPLDARIAVRDAAGGLLAENDDRKGPRVGTVLHQADPGVVFTVPADGEYFIEAADASGTGGAESFGFLRIAAPKPDFDCYVYPSAAAASFEAPAAVRVLAVRRGGFTGRIVLGTEPESPLRLVGVNSLEPGMERGLFTLALPRSERPDGQARPVGLFAVAEAPDGTKLRREVRAADEAMQAFAYTHLVPAERFLGARAWGPPHGRNVRFADPDRIVRIAPGGTARLRLRQRLPQGSEAHFILVNPPAGVTLSGSKSEAESATLTLRAEADAPEGPANTALRVEYFYTNKKGKRQKVSYLLPAFRIEVKR